MRRTKSHSTLGFDDLDPEAFKLAGVVKGRGLRQLPHAVADDRRLWAGALGMLAFRTAHEAGDYALNQVNMKRIFGLSKDRFYKFLKCLLESGYLRRHQPSKFAPDGSFSFTREELCLDPPPPGREGYAIWGARDFNSLHGLDMESVGVLVWLYSHAPGIEHTFWQINNRFEMPTATLKRRLQALVDRGLVERANNGRNERGEFTGPSYRLATGHELFVKRQSNATALPLKKQCGQAASNGVAANQDPETENPEPIHPDTPTSETHSNDCCTENSHDTEKEDIHVSFTRRTATWRQDLHATIQEEEDPEYDEPSRVWEPDYEWLDLDDFRADPELVDDLTEELPDEAMWSELRLATGGRIHPYFRGTPYLDEIRCWIASIAQSGDLSNFEAWQWLLGWTVRRVGSKDGKFLNDSGLILRPIPHMIQAGYWNDMLERLEDSDTSRLIDPELIEVQGDGYFRLCGESDVYLRQLLEMLEAEEDLGHRYSVSIKSGSLRNWSMVRQYVEIREKEYGILSGHEDYW